MSRYREDLDKVKQHQHDIRNKSVSELELKYPFEQHHPLINPIPYNLQNPYIKRDLEQQSYFARVGNQNI